MSTLLTWLRRIIYGLSIIVAICLIASSVARYISPDSLWILAFLALAWFPIFILNTFFILFWVIVRLKHAILPAIALLISFTDFTSYFAFHYTKSNAEHTQKSFRVMTYNTHDLGIDNWPHDEEILQNIMNLIKQQSPDIICFQEFYYQDSGVFQNIKYLNKNLGYKYSHFEQTAILDGYRRWGICTVSRYPIINSGRIEFKNRTKNAGMYTDIQIDDSILRVYNVHLQSIRFAKREYKYIDSLADRKSSNLDNGKGVLKKMRRAYMLRGRQADDIKESIVQSPYPVMVCGDFNDIPSSYAYHTIRGNLQDAFTKKGWGISHTYNGFLPIFRIDYVLPDKRFDVLNYTTIHKDYSDHYPVIVDLRKE